MSNIFGSIETGGTKIKVALLELLNDNYNNPDLKIVTEQEFPTATPEISMPIMADFFKPQINNIKAIGISTFGPANIDESSENYGTILQTPKLEWVNFSLLKYLREHLSFENFAFTSDVNGAGYGEARIGASKQTSSSIYTTVGTGIGSGIILHDKIFVEKDHAEIGHIYVQKHKADANFDGLCPYHKGCLEGLAAGPSYQARYGLPGHKLPPTHEVHDIIAFYLAQLCVNLTLTFRFEKLVFGGGVSKDEFLFPKIRSEFQRLLNNYVTTPPLDDYIVPAALGQEAGILGSGLLAIDKFHFGKAVY